MPGCVGSGGNITNVNFCLNKSNRALRPRDSKDVQKTLIMTRTYQDENQFWKPSWPPLPPITSSPPGPPLPPSPHLLTAFILWRMVHLDLIFCSFAHLVQHGSKKYCDEHKVSNLNGQLDYNLETEYWQRSSHAPCLALFHCLAPASALIPSSRNKWIQIIAMDRSDDSQSFTKSSFLRVHKMGFSTRSLMPLARSFLKYSVLIKHKLYKWYGNQIWVDVKTK